MSDAKIGHRFAARVGLVLVGLVAALLPIVPRVPARAATGTSGSSQLVRDRSDAWRVEASRPAKIRIEDLRLEPRS